MLCGHVFLSTIPRVAMSFLGHQYHIFILYGKRIVRVREVGDYIPTAMQDNMPLLTSELIHALKTKSKR
jgi:hypothetical protein